MRKLVLVACAVAGVSCASRADLLAPPGGDDAAVDQRPRTFDDVGPEEDAKEPLAVQLGDPCTAGSCADGLSCLEGARFPGGSCARSCGEGAPACPADARCVVIDQDAAPQQGTCLISCVASASTCRDGYRCREVRLLASEQATTVCIGAEEGSADPDGGPGDPDPGPGAESDGGGEGSSADSGPSEGESG